MNAIIIFVKYPAPHQVKTRLGAEIGHPLAAELYKLFITQTLASVQNADADQIFVAFEPKDRLNDFQNMFPEQVQLFPQEGGDLGQRMLNAFRSVYLFGGRNIVIVGSDSPTLPAQFINSAFHHLQSHDVVLGPAEDGGYYLLAMKAAHAGLFENIEWSSSSVLQTTLERAKQLQLSTVLLPPWYDVDEMQSLKRAAQDDASGRIKDFLLSHAIQQ